MATTGRLASKIAIVTGGSSGIGRAISLAYANEGAIVVVADLRDASTAPNEMDATTVDLILRAHGTGRAAFMTCDVSKSADVQHVVRLTVEQFGRLDIRRPSAAASSMVNNAGISIEGNYSVPIWEFEDEALLDHTLGVNVKGVFHGVRCAAAVMRTQEPDANGDRGWIVNMGSIFSHVGCARASAYVLSKHAVLGLTRSAALDCAADRVHINAVCPGFIRSSLTAPGMAARPESFHWADQMHPMGGMGSTQDPVGAAIFLASSDARWMTGSYIIVDGGYTAQ